MRQVDPRHGGNIGSILKARKGRAASTVQLTRPVRTILHIGALIMLVLSLAGQAGTAQAVTREEKTTFHLLISALDVALLPCRVAVYALAPAYKEWRHAGSGSDDLQRLADTDDNACTKSMGDRDCT